MTFAVTKSNYAAKPDPVLLRRDLDHGGALVPLDEADLATVAGARGKDPGTNREAAGKGDRGKERGRAPRMAQSCRRCGERPGAFPCATS